MATEKTGAGALGEKVGPLPLWAWALLGTVVIIGFYMYEKNKSSQAAAASAASTQAALSSPTGGAVSLGGVGGAAPLGENGVAPGSGTGYPTLSSWEAAAVSSLSGSGTYTPTQILTALQNFESGAQLNAQQTSIIDQTLSTIGAPPSLATTPNVSGTSNMTSTLSRSNSLTQLLGLAGTPYGTPGDNDVLTLIGNTITHSVTNAQGQTLNTEAIPGNWTAITGQGWVYSNTLKTPVYYVQGNSTDGNNYTSLWYGGQFHSPILSSTMNNVIGTSNVPYGSVATTGQGVPT